MSLFYVFNIHLARVTLLCSGWLVVLYVHKRETVFPKDMDNQPENTVSLFHLCRSPFSNH